MGIPWSPSDEEDPASLLDGALASPPSLRADAEEEEEEEEEEVVSSPTIVVL